jgi:hypothetical protein
MSTHADGRTDDGWNRCMYVEHARCVYKIILTYETQVISFFLRKCNKIEILLLVSKPREIALRMRNTIG